MGRGVRSTTRFGGIDVLRDAKGLRDSPPLWDSYTTTWNTNLAALFGSRHQRNHRHRT